MARDIPYDKPLSRADRQYLEDRGQYALVARLDQNFPQDDPDEQPLPATGNPNVDLLVQENGVLTAEVKELRRQLAEVHQSQEPVNANDSGDELPPYAKWKKAELVAETTARGLSSEGTVPELAARLDEYDAAQ